MPVRDVLARTAFAEAVESCKKRGFLESVSGEGNSTELQSTESKSQNWYWYRGTAFHVFAVPEVAARILQHFVRNGVRETSTEILLVHYKALREVWRMELFWPRRISSESLLDAGLRVLEHLGVVRLSAGRVTILCKYENAPDRPKAQDTPGTPEPDAPDELGPEKSLDFVAGLILPEQEIYGLQITAALKLVEARGGFKRDELVHQTFLLHRSAFLTRSCVPAPVADPGLRKAFF